MRRGHFIILVGGAMVLFLLLVFAELLSEGESEVEASVEASVEVGVPDVETVREEVVRIPAERGQIVDRAGRTLAETRRAGRLRIDLEALIGYYRDELGKSVPENRMFVERSGEREMVVEEDVYAVVHAMVVVPLREEGVTLEAKTELIREHYRERRGEGLLLEVTEWGASEEPSFGLMEWSAGVEGVFFEEYWKRVYPEGELTDAVVGAIDRETGEGVRGAELLFDAELSGKWGEVVNEVSGGMNGKEASLRELSREPAVAGETVALGLDVEKQRVVWEMMTGVARGAAVVLDGETGELVILVTKPGIEGEEGGGDESERQLEVAGVGGVLEAITLLGESGGDEALLEGLVERLGERGGSLFEGNWETVGALFGMTLEDDYAVKASAMELARLGASLVNGGKVVEVRIGLAAGTAEGGEEIARSFPVSEAVLAKLVSGLRDPLGGGEKGIWLDGGTGPRGNGRWMVFGVEKGGTVYGGCVTDVDGTSVNLIVLGKRLAREVLGVDL